MNTKSISTLTLALVSNYVMASPPPQYMTSMESFLKYVSNTENTVGKGSVKFISSIKSSCTQQSKIDTIKVRTTITFENSYTCNIEGHKITIGLNEIQKNNTTKSDSFGAIVPQELYDDLLTSFKLKNGSGIKMTGSERIKQAYTWNTITNKNLPTNSIIGQLPKIQSAFIETGIEQY